MSEPKQNEIPVLDLSPEIEFLWDDLNDVIQRVLRSTSFILGSEVTAFEEEVAEYLGVKHAVGVNSGTDALVISLRILGIGPGDEVITSPFSFFATAEAISQVGATPVFTDIEHKTFNIDPALIEEKINTRTRAIIPVHLFGQTADMDPIMSLADRFGLKVLEDVAQAFGAEHKGQRLGSIGDAGAFSFFPSKNLGAYGDGGLITTDDNELADVARKLRTHGSIKKYHNEMLGYNSRLDSIQAAILRVKLPHIDTYNAGRRSVATIYNELLSDTPGIVTPYEIPYGKHVFHQYTIRLTDGRRNEAEIKLREAGINTMIYYPVPIHKLPIYSDMKIDLPVSELAAQEVLSLPIWPQMKREMQERVVEVLLNILV